MGKEERLGMLAELDETTRELTEILWQTGNIAKDLKELADILKQVTIMALPTTDKFPHLKKYADLDAILKIAARAQELAERKTKLEKALGISFTKTE
jgi:hypothetical protein